MYLPFTLSMSLTQKIHFDQTKTEQNENYSTLKPYKNKTKFFYMTERGENLYMFIYKRQTNPKHNGPKPFRSVGGHVYSGVVSKPLQMT